MAGSFGSDYEVALHELLDYGLAMNREEFESALQEFETDVRKRLPALINIALANKGNREHETAFNHFLDMLQRQRKILLRDLSRLAKAAQKVRYFNAVYNIDSQLRAMSNRDAYQQQLKLRRHTMHASIVYDLGDGSEDGELLNVWDEGVVVQSAQKVTSDHEVKISVSGKSAQGKTLWSIQQRNGSSETGIKITNASQDFWDELNKHVEDNREDL